LLLWRIRRWSGGAAEGVSLAADRCLGSTPFGLRDGLSHAVWKGPGDVTHNLGVLEGEIALSGHLAIGAQNCVGPEDGVAVRATIQMPLQRPKLRQHVILLQPLGRGHEHVVEDAALLGVLLGGVAPSGVLKNGGSHGDDL
jgi:hypothetical protein